MFDSYVLSKGSIKNEVKNGSISGFSMKTLIPYYRGIPCSMVHVVEVIVDGEPVPQDKILFSLDGKDFFTLEELITVSSYKWEYGEEAIVYVDKEGGLSFGEHEITLRMAIRVAYIPVPFAGQRSEIVKIA